MLWRKLMLAPAGAESVPAPVIDRVGRIARGLQAEIEIFLSLYEPDILQTLESRELLEARIAARVEEQHRQLERIADQLRDQGLTVRTSVRWDYPMFEGVIRQVLRHRPDLLILPAIQTTGMAARTLEYREARLIEACPCPLLLLKTLEVYSSGCVLAAVDPLHGNGAPQELDERIVQAAKTLAYALADAPVQVYHAVSPPTPSAGDIPGAALPYARQAARRTRVEARIADIAFRHDISRDRVQVESGPVATSLPAFARQQRAQAVVMGAMSRSFPERALFGHTAERVLGTLACDVLVVKPEHFQTPVSADPAPAVPRPT